MFLTADVILKNFISPFSLYTFLVGRTLLNHYLENILVVITPEILGLLTVETRQTLPLEAPYAGRGGGGGSGVI